MFDTILNAILDNFDLSYCVIVNIATYIIIRAIDEVNGNKDVTTWQKRIVLLVVVTITAIVYYAVGVTPKLIVNSSVLAPVSWSWVFKPICKKLGIDYKKIETVGD